MRWPLVAITFAVAIVAAPVPVDAKKKALGSHQVEFATSKSDIKSIAKKINAVALCAAVSTFMKIENQSTSMCNPLEFTFSDGKSIKVEISRSNDPGNRRFVFDIKGSSELLAGAKPGGSESHRIDVLFMFDFDGTLYVNSFDTDPRVSARSPDKSGDVDYVLMERIYDTRNQDMIGRLNDSMVDQFDEELPVSLQSAQSR